MTGNDDDLAADEEAFARVLDRLSQLGLSERRASILAFGHPSGIQNVRTKRTQSPRTRFFRRLAPVLQTTPAWLAFGAGPPPAPPPSPTPAMRPGPDLGDGPADFPPGGAAFPPTPTGRPPPGS